MRLSKKYWACILLCCVASTSALRAEELSERFYLSAGGGSLDLGGYCDGDRSVCKQGESFYSIGGGYRINSHVSVEATGMHASGFEKTYSVRPPAASNDIDIVTRGDFNSYMLGAKLILPIEENLSFFGKLGAHLWQLDSEGRGTATSSTGLTIPHTIKSDADDVGIYYGAGMQYIFGKIALRGEYTHYKVTEDSKPHTAFPEKMVSYGGSILFYF